MISPRFLTSEQIDEIQALLRGGPSIRTVALLAKVNERTLRRWVAAGTFEFDTNYQNPADIAEAQRLLSLGFTAHEIVRRTKLKTSTVQNWIRSGRIILPAIEEVT